MCTMNTDGAKKSAKSPALESHLPTDEVLEINIKLWHYVAIMWESCVIGNPTQLNPCEYGWERNEGEKSLDLPCFQLEWKSHLMRYCKQPAANVFQPSAKKNKSSYVRAGLNCSKFCDCQQCDDQSEMHMDDNEIEDENNDSESGTEDE